jgi:uncharacterized membrane protein HdeD (DUF308 family)
MRVGRFALIIIRQREALPGVLKIPDRCPPKPGSNGEKPMNLQQELTQINPRYEEYFRLKHLWSWFFFLGFALMGVGILAMAAALVTTLATVLVFGIVLSSGGGVQLVNAFLARTWKGFVLHLLAGVLYLVVGGLMIADPVSAAAGLTLMLAAVFLIVGAVRLIYAALHSFSGRGWALLGGFISMLLGIAIWKQWPDSGLWVIGLFIGIDLLFSGWSWVMLGLLVKAPPSKASHTEAAAPSSVVSATS